MVKKIVILFLFIILLLPYILLLKEIHFVITDWNELAEAFGNTVLQSVLSAAVVISLGFWSALGLCHLEKSERHKNKLKYFEFMCLIPSFLPALFFVTAVLQIVRPFPFGILGIIFIHTLMYVGLSGLFFQNIFHTKFHKMSEQAYLEGSSQSLFIFAVIKNMSFEITMMFLFLFVQFFTSFSVPLLVGMQNLTLETLIYEKIRTTGYISEAITISFLESIFIAILLMFYKSKAKLDTAPKNLYLLGSRIGLIIIVLPVGLFALGSLAGSSMGIKQLMQDSGWVQNIFAMAIRSVGLSIFTGIALLLVLSLVAFVYKNKYFDKFLLSYIPLSTVLIALGLLLVNFNFGFIEQDIKFVMALVILFLPVLYRFELKTKLQALESQIEIANLMGASGFLTFKKIVFPQVFPSIVFLSGLGAFWAIGDFAISQIIYGKDVTLALYIQSLVGSYRLELANLLVLFLLILGLLVFVTFKEMRHVVSQKN